MHPIIDQFLTDLPALQPKTYKAVYPRRIVPPGGFVNPKYFSATLWGEFRTGFEPAANSLPHVSGIINAICQMAYRVPTYFVRNEFAQAVAQTELPEDFKFSEIKWPLPAMLFVLPTNFVREYFGHMCPFLSITRVESGIYPSAIKNLPECNMPVYGINPIKNEVDRFVVLYPVYTNQHAPVDYTGSYPLDMLVTALDKAPYTDSTQQLLEDDSDADLFGAYNPKTSTLPKGEAEKVFNAKVQHFAVKLMMALSVRPNFIQNGSLARVEKVKKGKHVVGELWNPNLIGWDYKARRTGLPEAPVDADAGEALACVHRSPRMHWRRGHMRNQPHGPKPWTKDSPKELKWIEPILVNAPDERPRTQ